MMEFQKKEWYLLELVLLDLISTLTKEGQIHKCKKLIFIYGSKKWNKIGKDQKNLIKWSQQQRNDTDLELAEETQGRATDEFIGMLQILAIGITDQDHLLQELAISWGLRDNLPKDEQQLFDIVVLQRQDEANDCHEQSRNLFPIDKDVDGLFQGLSLHPGVSPLEVALQLLLWWVLRVRCADQSVAWLLDSRHLFNQKPHQIPCYIDQYARISRKTSGCLRCVEQVWTYSAMLPVAWPNLNVAIKLDLFAMRNAPVARVGAPKTTALGAALLWHVKDVGLGRRRRDGHRHPE